MFNPQPQTYEEAKIIATCLSLRQYVKNIDDTFLEYMYNIFKTVPNCLVSLTPNTLYVLDGNGQQAGLFNVETYGSFNKIVFRATGVTITNTTTTSGCGSCGCSSNNNNNNNNNNNG